MLQHQRHAWPKGMSSLNLVKLPLRNSWDLSRQNFHFQCLQMCNWLISSQSDLDLETIAFTEAANDKSLTTWCTSCSYLISRYLDVMLMLHYASWRETSLRSRPKDYIAYRPTLEPIPVTLLNTFNLHAFTELWTPTLSCGIPCNC